MTDDESDLALLGDLLERSFDAGPAGLPTPAERVAEGRRALRRRRRIGLVATSAGVVAAIGVGVALSGATGDHGADGAPPVATSGPSPSAPPTETSGTVPSPAPKPHKQQQRLVSAMFPASFDYDGSIVVKDGWRITRQVDEPLGLLPPEKSAGVVVERGDHVRWMLITLEHGTDAQGNVAPDVMSLGASADDPGTGYSRYDDWLAAQVELNGGPRTSPLLTVDRADQLRPGPGVELVETRPAPVIPRYTTEGDRLAEVVRDGRTWFVVVRGHGARAQVLPVDAALLPEPTFDALAAYVRSQVASGAGLR